jgi:hypothetical protein
MNERSKSAAVVAAWFAGNAVLAALLPAFGERSFAVVLFAVATALPALAAVAVLAGDGRNGEPEERFTLAANAIWVVPAALGLVLIGVGAISSIWLVYVGGIGVLAACVQLLRRPDRSRAEVTDGE